MNENEKVTTSSASSASSPTASSASWVVHELVSDGRGGVAACFGPFPTRGEAEAFALVQFAGQLDNDPRIEGFDGTTAFVDEWGNWCTPEGEVVCSVSRVQPPAMPLCWVDENGKVFAEGKPGLTPIHEGDVVPWFGAPR